ncbi:hypothetical protein [Motiliproteus sp. MSK22-1]|uniref:hypothetical protein n=1 Tax=Motiliproteus sp. MSK22-1 TaxID=1897630 RepID=UPI0009767EED|nr:hypothetical protein [Motiliproteus sp. MSK22-1]OMH30265.1 hypothetical protein BGP75_17895 [Motiliproteus sp. MSK22-1]
MQRALVLIAAIFLISGCEPSFKEEYESTLKELEETKKALGIAQQRLKAADNEIRHNIFSLIRKSNTHLLTDKLDLAQIDQIAQELQVHIESYQQLAGQTDHVSVTSEFYLGKLTVIYDLIRNSRAAYNRQFNECLTGIESKGGKNDLSSMLCEVQADVARQEFNNKLDASIKALLVVTKQQVQAGRQAASTTASSADLEQRFKAEVKKAQLSQTS